MEAVLVVGLRYLFQHGGGLGHHVLVDGLKHLPRNGIGCVVEVVDVAQQEAEGVAELAVGVGRALQDLVADGNVLAVIDRAGPHAQNLGAELLVHLVRVDGVAQRLGHLLAVFVHGEATADDVLVRRDAVGGHAGEQRRLEPTAMLVGAFQVHIGRAAQVIARLAHGGVAYAGFPPNVQHVLVGLQVVDARTALRAAGVGRQEIGRGLLVPGIGALGLEQVDNRVEGFSGCHGFAAGIAGEHRDRHTPETLAGDAPVGTVGHHGTDAIGSPGGEPVHLILDGL